MSIRLHVGNLGPGTREADLEDMFNRIGLVMSVSIPLDGKGNRKPFGFVNMTEAGAEAAIHSLDGSVLRERQITVRAAGAHE